MTARTTVIGIAVAAAFAFAGLCAAEAPAQVTAFKSDPSRFQSNDGAYLYRAVCQGCHMPKGEGATGAGTYPALAGNPRMASPLYPAIIVLNGYKGMPAMGSLFDDEQIAAVVNHVRSNFGNTYADALTAQQVKALRNP